MERGLSNIKFSDTDFKLVVKGANFTQFTEKFDLKSNTK